VGERPLTGSRAGVPDVGAGVVALSSGLSKVESIAVRSSSFDSYREIITRGSLRGRMVLASACLSQFQLA
jgi:hypothetical protein